ncbi:MAG: hypothetical protein ACKVOW_01455 [Chitinophagaceae bacterium]
MQAYMILIAICIFASSSVCSQGQNNNRKIIENKKEAKVFTKVESESGTNWAEWKKYLEKNSLLTDSEIATIPNGIYQALINFVIDIHGNIVQLKLLNDPGYGLGKRAIQLLKNYTGEWYPASQCGRFVKSYKELPIVFKISN